MSPDGGGAQGVLQPEPELRLKSGLQKPKVGLEKEPERGALDYCNFKRTVVFREPLCRFHVSFPECRILEAIQAS